MQETLKVIEIYNMSYDELQESRNKRKEQYNSREWEYMVRYVGDINPLTPQGLTLFLNQEGAAHWELVTYDVNRGLLIFKRPKL